MDPQRESYLPNELWDLIFDHGEQKDFVAVSLVCKRLHQLVKPYLYREFNWIPDVDYMFSPIEDRSKGKMVHCLPKWRKQKSKESNCFRPPPYLLLRTLLRRPCLAHHVKNVKLLAVPPYFGLFWNEYDARRNGLRQYELFRCYKAIRNMSTVDDKSWKKWLHEGRLDVILGILLSLLPNLSSADIRVRYCNTSGNLVFRGLCSRRYLKGSHKISQIKSVTVSLDNDEERRWPNVVTRYDTYHMDEQIFWLLRLPRLEHLSISQLHDGIMGFMFFQIQAYHSVSRSLKQLKLPHSFVSEKGLDALLHATPRLEDLECDLRYNCAGPKYCNGEKLIATLSKVSGTLKRLKLNFEVIYGRRRDDIVVEAPMGSMKHFKKLKHLDIPLILIIPSFGDVSSSTLENILPDRMGSMILRPHPCIMDDDRRAMACRALSGYVSERPWLNGDRTSRLASPSNGKRFGIIGDEFKDRVQRITGLQNGMRNMNLQHSLECSESRDV